MTARGDAVKDLGRKNSTAPVRVILGKQAKKSRWGFFVKRVTENARNEVRLCQARLSNIFSGRVKRSEVELLRYPQKRVSGISDGFRSE